MSQQLISKLYTPLELIKAYWQSDERVAAYTFLISVIFMTMCIVGMDLLINYWYNHFYDALQEYDKTGAIDLIMVFMLLAAIYIVLAVYRFYLQQFLGLRWRRWLTEQIMARWLEHKNYYYLENFEATTDNPDQRVQEDVNALVTYTLDLAVGLISSVTTFCCFIFVLWKLSGPLNIHLGSWGTLHIPAYLVWVALLYNGIGTYLVFKVGRPLVNLNFEQQKREADFRYSAVDLRSHAEHVALYRGEQHQADIFTRLFNLVLGNAYAIIIRQKLLLWFTAGYNQIAILVPLIAALPNYFGKVFKLGGLMQTLTAFRQIQDALSYFINAFNTIALWRAVTKRLLTFINHMYEIESRGLDNTSFTYSSFAFNKIALHKVNLYSPRGEKLLLNVEEEFIHGKNYLLKGRSGIGKSSLLRVIAGVWPYGVGEVIVPQHDVMYIPQKSYMPLGTLKEALLFPNKLDPYSDAALTQLLTLCGLQNLVPRLHEEAPWSEQLSGGEQQRIAFVRILLQKPQWVFLDESTSSLDLANEERLYNLLKTELPQCSVISIAHQPSLEKFHDVQIDLTQYAVTL